MVGQGGDSVEHPHDGAQEFSQNPWNSSGLNAGQTNYSQWAGNPPNQWGTVPEAENHQKVSSQPAEQSWGTQSLNTEYKNSLPVMNSQPPSFDYYPQPKDNNQVRF